MAGGGLAYLAQPWAVGLPLAPGHHIAAWAIAQLESACLFLPLRVYSPLPEGWRRPHRRGVWREGCETGRWGRYPTTYRVFPPVEKLVFPWKRQGFRGKGPLFFQGWAQFAGKTGGGQEKLRPSGKVTTGSQAAWHGPPRPPPPVNDGCRSSITNPWTGQDTPGRARAGKSRHG